MTSIEGLEIAALNAMASSLGGAMTLADLTSHLDTRLGSTAQASKDAQSPESRDFRDSVQRLISPNHGSGSLVDRALATVDDTGALVRITDAGRQFIGR